MKNILKVIMHISFVVFTLTLLSLLLFDSYEFDTVRGTFESHFTMEDTDSSFEETNSFNQQLGSSVADVISYCGIMDEMDSNEFRESVSGNTVIGQDNDGGIYKEHGRYEDYFSASNSNIRFFVIEKVGKDVITRTNLPGVNVAKANLNDLKNGVLKECNKYIYLDGLNHVYETNTMIEESTVYTLFNNSSYAFPIDTTIMVGVNKNLAQIDDNYSLGNRVYNYGGSNFLLRIITMALSGFLYFVLMIVLAVIDGVTIDKENKKRTIKLGMLDRVPCEIRIILLLAVGLLMGTFLSEFYNLKPVLRELFFNNSIGVIVLGAVCSLILSLCISFFLLGFFRRLKGRIIFKTSLCSKLIEVCIKAMDSIFDNKGSIVKVAIPYAMLCLLNIVLTFIAVDTKVYFLIVVVVILDIIDGYGIYKNYLDKEQIIEVINKICKGDINAKARDDLKGDNKKLANAVNQIGESVNAAVNTSMKDEKMKADLITNVSHDLKTPLTSIINYVDLLKKERIDNENAKSYIAILDEKSQRLKQLTDDLVEASKISSGNIVLQMEKINVKQLLSQVGAEFIDKFEEKRLSFVGSAPENDIFINADSRRIYRVIDNLFTNVYKYALEGTRIYLDVINQDKKVYICVKNISANPLNVSPEELLERFVRGDESRNTEGSGLGLSIAKNLTEAMGGAFEIYLDGDLFKVVLTFDEV